MNNAQTTYFENQILGASPQQLRLLLLNGAIRFGGLTMQYWDQAMWEEAMEALIRCRGIISELLAGIKSDSSPLAKQVAGVYATLFRTLAEVQIRRDRDQLQKVLDVLEIERETWQQVCDTTETSDQHPDSFEFRGDDSAAGFPAVDFDPLPEGGLSLDA